MASHRRRARDAPRGSPPEWSPEPPGRAGTGRDAFLGEGAVGLAEPRIWKRAFLRRTTPAWMTAAVCPQPTSAIRRPAIRSAAGQRLLHPPGICNVVACGHGHLQFPEDPQRRERLEQTVTAAHDHDHDHHYQHDRDPDHDEHAHTGGLAGLWRKVGHVVTPHSHDAAGKVDQALETSRDGIRALWVSLAVLGSTALLQALVVVLSGSVALLGDTL